MSEIDRKLMKRALKLARRGLLSTGVNPRVGCVISKDGNVVGEGYHKITGTAHAEIHALAHAGPAAKGGTAYVTLEPCSHHGLTPPCADALVKAQISKAVICNNDPNPLVAGNGIKALRAAGIETVSGLLTPKGEKLNPGFFKRMKTGRPFVRLKLAQSLDGRTAMESGESYWITGPKARNDVQAWRGRSHAILTGIGTVLQDDCRLTVRAESLPGNYKALAHNFETEQPMRIILDSGFRIPETAKVLNGPGRRVVISLKPATCPKSKRLQARGIELITLPSKKEGRIDLECVLDWLGEEQINELLVETGATLAGQFLHSDLVDQMIIYTAPVLMGSSARPLVHLDLQNMKERRHLHNVRRKKIGKDWRTIADLK